MSWGRRSPVGVGEEAKEGSTGLLASVLSQWVPQVTQTISCAPDVSWPILFLLTIMPHLPPTPIISLKASLSPQSWPLSQIPCSETHQLTLGEHREFL